MGSRLVGVFAPLLVGAVLFSAPFDRAQAISVVNGDFSDPVDLAGWTATGTVVGEPAGDFGQLDTDGGFLRTLAQTLSIPALPSTLTFDFAFSTEATPPPGGLFPDSFVATLETSGLDFLDILLVDAVEVVPDPSDGIEGITGSLPIDVDYDPAVGIPGFVPFAGGITYSGRISLALPAAVLGQVGTLYFDLFDEPDGVATIAAVDNVSVAPAHAMPLPATFTLVLIGLAAAATGRRKP